MRNFKLALLAATAALALAPLTTKAADLIERQILFGNPSKAQGLISPNGQWLSWLAPKDGVLNIFVAPIDHPDQAKAVSDEKGRPIRQHFWSADSKMILWINDKN